MIRLALFVLVLLVPIAAAPIAGAQPRVYVGATTAIDAGERGNIPGGSVPSVGAVIGLTLSDAWGVEFELERGFRTTHAGSGEGVLLSFPPTRTPTREAIELYGIRTRDERTQTAGAGWAAHARWRSREPGRVNVGLLAGECHAVRETKCRDLPLQRLALRSVAHDEELRVTALQPENRVDEETVALPASQRRDDPQQRDVHGQSEPVTRVGLRDSRIKRCVDAGGYRIHALRIEPVVADELLAQRFARGHGSRGRAAVEPASGCVILHRSVEWRSRTT